MDLVLLQHVSHGSMVRVLLQRAGTMVLVFLLRARLMVLVRCNHDAEGVDGGPSPLEGVLFDARVLDQPLPSCVA